MDEISIQQYLKDLASKQPVPGGGGSVALVAAVGTALGGMVAGLTSGKKKYAAVQPEIDTILHEAEQLRGEMERLIKKDEDVFEPLSRAYKLPKSTEEEQAYKEKVLEENLVFATEVPLEIMRKSMEAIDLHRRLFQTGTKSALSDIGVGVSFCKAALEGGALSVYINTQMMKDKDKQSAYNEEAETLLNQGTDKSNSIYHQIEAKYKV